MKWAVYLFVTLTGGKTRPSLEQVELVRQTLNNVSKRICITELNLIPHEQTALVAFIALPQCVRIKVNFSHR